MPRTSKATPKPKALSAQEVMDEVVRKQRGHRRITRPVSERLWMDTGEPLLHRVMGSPERGLPYGRMIEISGNESQGKSLLALDLAAQAQDDGADVLWLDLESSWDPVWAESRGVDLSKICVVSPYEGYFSKNQKTPELISAEGLCEEVEAWMAEMENRKTNGKRLVVVDSITAMLVEDENTGGILQQNMRTQLALPSFLSRLMRRWITRINWWNTMMLFINQLRLRPGVYGNPEQTSGGKALRFYLQVRVVMRRKGRLLSKGKQTGIKGVLQNIKNKAGAGSIEGEKVGFKLYFDGRSEFVPVDEVVEEGDEK